MVVNNVATTAPVVRRTVRTRIWTVALSVVAVSLLAITTIVLMAPAMRRWRMDARNVVHPTTLPVVHLTDLTQMFTAVHTVAAALVNSVIKLLLRISVADYVARRTTRTLAPGTDRIQMTVGAHNAVISYTAALVLTVSIIQAMRTVVRNAVHRTTHIATVPFLDRTQMFMGVNSVVRHTIAAVVPRLDHTQISLGVLSVARRTTIAAV